MTRHAVSLLAPARSRVSAISGPTMSPSAWVPNTIPTSLPRSLRLAYSLTITALTGESPPTPNPSTKRNAISTQYEGDSADPRAPTTMIAATSQYTRLRPIRSANRPKTNAPRHAAASIVELSRARLPELRVQSLVIRADAIPTTKRSEGPVNTPTPDATPARG